MPQIKSTHIEEKYGKPLREILVESYEECGGRSRVARKLGVSPATITLWLALCGLHEVKRIEPITNTGERN